MTEPADEYGRRAIDLRQRARALEEGIAWTREGTPPPLRGELLLTLPMGASELRLVWLADRRHPYVRLSSWSKDLHGQWWPERGAVWIDLPDLGRLAEAIAQALERAEGWVAAHGRKKAEQDQGPR